MNPLPEINSLLKLAKNPVTTSSVSQRVALLADTSSQILAGALIGIAKWRGFRFDIYEADFDQIDLDILNPNSALHAFAPETAILYLASEPLASKFSALQIPQRACLAVDFLQRISGLHAVLSSRGCQTICFNLSDPGDGVFGHYANKVSSSLTYQIRSINCGLMRLAEASADFHVYDLARLQTQLGSAITDPKLFCSAKIAISPEATRFVARDLIQMISVRHGGGHKCIILDLDNTLWGGVIGDDGLDHIQIGELGLGVAFSQFQGWLKQLKDRGMVLAVCSKNEDATAREPFIKHPEMVLRLDDIAVFVANWKDKATNIRAIKEVVDVDFSATVFLDDNPVERALVRESFPSMTVPELPVDPCEYVSFLQSLNLFETASYTTLDAERTRSYQAETQRRSERERYVDESGFLKSLAMSATVGPFTPFQYPRIAQLTQRSNQFNLRTVRFTEKQIEALKLSPQYRTLAIELADKCGDYGLISVIVLERQADSYFINTWLMSCRVLGRGVESIALNGIVAAARADRVIRIIGEYLPTAKNGMVKDHFLRLGFTPLGKGNRWAMDVPSFVDRQAFITVRPASHS
jgi:FkbH-like protein